VLPFQVLATRLGSYLVFVVAPLLIMAVVIRLIRVSFRVTDRNSSARAPQPARFDRDFSGSVTSHRPWPAAGAPG